ncbi:Raf kinase inhibitor-like YbhB/YbcL family protein [Actinoplanes octamycinicus]|uniref:Raf kinase inhibitor-like YbhB/YbcL family protein n=1 Tax=Actinoplanes octamycinicus TaxID=135948 RepID=A0A7W7MB35_9ACTN|nr:YbhB/YbcL family Raf kinase inhibitor-like protein [Actinoplanes octamycinicus]MBB4743719.1 Raf kinase inhibitor-like YbhB/YbcL family protein [Actinoplanes octamycinicus]GIE61148.1 kinase inhibitor [Actinoplanes octamycinicus]
MMRTAAAIVSAAALAAGTFGYHHTPRGNDGGFGYHQVRDGIPQSAGHFRVSSPDVRTRFPADDLANGFGCTGSNEQPRLTWSGAPAGTRSLAVTMYDPDAPTGSGFWHWLAWDLPATSRSLDRAVPAGAVAGTNDAGQLGYVGPCPPVGDVAHHYEITVYALDVPTLGLPAATPPAATMFTMREHILAYGRMTVTAKR